MVGKSARWSWCAVSSLLLVITCGAADDESPDHAPEYEISEILAHWAEASEMRGSFCFQFDSYDYDTTLGRETRGVATLQGDGAGTIEFRVDPAVIGQQQNPHKLTADGEPFEVVAAGTSSVVWANDFILYGDSLVWARSRNPGALLTNAIRDALLSPPPRVSLNLIVNADELNELFRWEFGDLQGSGIHLRGTPRSEEVARTVSRVEVILNETTWLPDAYREFNAYNERVLVVRGRYDSIHIGDVHRRIRMAEALLAESSNETHPESPAKPETWLASDMSEILRAAHACLHPIPTLLEIIREAYDNRQLPYLIL